MSFSNSVQNIVNSNIASNAAIALSKLQGAIYTAITDASRAGTASLTYVMYGAGANWTVTPTQTGKMIFIATSHLKNNTVGDGAQVGLRYGTGAAPANGAAQTGTAPTPDNIIVLVEPVAGDDIPFTLVTSASLTVSTAYWVDFQFRAVTAGTAAVGGTSAPSILMIELI